MYYQEYVSPIGKMFMTSDGEYLTGLFSMVLEIALKRL